VPDYTNSKPGLGAYHDPDQVVAAEVSRYEPLIDAQGIRDRILWGIKLVSMQTKQEMSDDLIDTKIQDAIALVEQETGIQIGPTQHDERQAFDRNEYAAMGYFRLQNRPVTSIESLRIVASNDTQLWQVSQDWIDTGYLSKGEIYIVPINVAVSSQAGTSGAAGGAAFLAILGQQGWVPAFWRIKYTTGFANGKLPRNINLLIGYQTGLIILADLAAANAKFGSKSLGVDGLSQSSSNPGAVIYDRAIEELEKKKKMLIGKTKNQYGTKMFSGNV
jgi:hypothetical protein